MAAGLGEATAIMAVIDAGLSMATTLKAYVDAYHDAPEDIRHLASDLKSSMGYVKELKDMLEENKRTPALNENGVAEANTCLQQADEIVRTLASLIRKGSRQDLPTSDLKLDDLDMSKFQQMAWFFFNSSPLERRLYETQVVAVDYVLENGDINALNDPPIPANPPETEVQLPQRHAHFGDKNMSGDRSKEVAMRDPHINGGKPFNPLSSGPQSQMLPPGLNGAPVPPPPPTTMQVYNANPVVKQRFIPIEQAKREYEIEFRERLLAKEQEETDALKLREDAQAEYRQGLVEQLAERQRKMNDARDRLVRIFGEELPPEKIDAYLTEQNAAQDVSEDLFNFITDVVNKADRPPAAVGAANRAAAANGVVQTNAGVQSGWGFGLTARSNQPATNGSGKRPEFLAFILAERSHEWTMTQADVPRSVLKLIKRSRRGNGSSAQEVLQTTLKVYSALNSKCLRMLESWLARQRAEHNLVWGLSYACAWFSGQRRRFRYRALRALAAIEPASPTVEEEPADSLLLVFRLLDVVKDGRKPNEGGWDTSPATRAPGSNTTPPDSVSGTFGRKPGHYTASSYSYESYHSDDLPSSKRRGTRSPRRSRSRSRLRYRDDDDSRTRSRSRERARRPSYFGLGRSRSREQWDDDDDAIETRRRGLLRERRNRSDDPYEDYLRREERRRDLFDHGNSPHYIRSRDYDEYEPAPFGPRSREEYVDREIFVGPGQQRRVVRVVENARGDYPRRDYYSRDRTASDYEEDEYYTTRRLYTDRRDDERERIIEIERERPVRRTTLDSFASIASDNDRDRYRETRLPPSPLIEREEIIIRRDPTSSADAGKLIIRERERDVDSGRDREREMRRERERELERDRIREEIKGRLEREREKETYEEDRLRPYSRARDEEIDVVIKERRRDRTPSPPPPPPKPGFLEEIIRERRSSRASRPRRSESPRHRSNYRSSGGNVLVRERQKDGEDDTKSYWTREGRDITRILKGMDGDTVAGKELVPYEASVAAERLAREKLQQKTPQRKDSGDIMDDERSQTIMDKYSKKYTIDPPAETKKPGKSTAKPKSGLATVVEDAPPENDEGQQKAGAERSTKSGEENSNTANPIFSEPESDQDFFLASSERLDQSLPKTSQNDSGANTKQKP